jgi:hypothetical protein
MPDGDLDITQVRSGVEHGSGEGVLQHMRMRPGDREASISASRRRRRVVACRSILLPWLLSRKARPAGRRRLGQWPADRWRQQDQDSPLRT